MEERWIQARPVEPSELNFPFARSIIALRCRRHWKKDGKSSEETRYYLSSEPAESRSPAQWDELIRGHWAGVEIRNHWRRDAIMGEDRSRASNPNQLANLSLLRSAVVCLLARQYPETNYVETREELQQSADKCFKLATSAR